jgi:NADP-dependent 3-hydroxy acid dehydrogenase YdfG
MYKLAFITGATSGIGEAMARLFAKNNIALVINGRRQERLEALAKELGSLVPVHIAHFDVCDNSAIEKWFHQNPTVAQSVDILVNNAGLARGTDPIHLGKVRDWDEMIDTNIKGLLYVSHHIIPQMKKNSKGHIINLGSVAGRWTYPGGAVYSATKFAVRALTEGFRTDLLGSSIRVSNIEPGMVETEFSNVRFANQSDCDEKAKSVYRGLKPLSAMDIAETALWILQRPAHVNIQELVIFPTDQASIRDVHRS